MAELMMLRFEGAMQSWGEDSAWDNRDTAGYPSKSGIVGMLACAMGLPRESEDIFQLSAALKVGVRADRLGTAGCDLQTIQGMPKVLNAMGKSRANIVSYRWYLQDASFLIILETTLLWQERIENALKNPVWFIYLGRKNCVPSRPVWDGIHKEYDSILDAVRRYPAAPGPQDFLPYQVEDFFPEGESLTRSDEIIGRRIFQRRKVWLGTIRRDKVCI